ncbi:hypothetical protein CR513_57602, partial [Mucuna pruriens]
MCLAQVIDHAQLILMYKLVIETPKNDFIVTLNVCLSLSQLDINLGTPIVGKDDRYIISNQAKIFLKENA